VPALNLAVCEELSSKNKLTKDNPQVMYQDLISEQNLNDCAPRLFNPISLTTNSSLTTNASYLISLTTNASYLAGLLEGDGTIIVPITERSVKNKNNYPSVQISFAAKDYPLITMLRLSLGYGSISKRKMQAAYIFTINDRKGITSLVNILNGLLRTPKIHDFDNLARYLGIAPKGLDSSPLSSNA
jgi:hypothetical protein